MLCFLCWLLLTACMHTNMLCQAFIYTLTQLFYFASKVGQGLHFRPFLPDFHQNHFLETQHQIDTLYQMSTIQSRPKQSREVWLCIIIIHGII